MTEQNYQNPDIPKPVPEPIEEGMTLTKAREILDNHGFKPEGATWVDFFDAIQLGIEAMKVLEHGRLIGAHHDPYLLPGETKK